MDRNALARATESSDSPTPGYLYVDIAKSAASSPASSHEVVQYLIRRLQSKNNPNVKYKCLKVIAKTAESSITRGQFKRAVAQDPRAVGAIKECLQFRGPPDPVRGEEPYAKVREAAKEALDAVYSDAPTSSSSGGVDAGAGPGPFSGIAGGGGGGMGASYGAPPHASGMMGGYGPGGAVGGMNPSHGGGGGGGGVGGVGGPRKMEGIGNPMYKDPRLSQGQGGGGIGSMTIGEIAKVAGETVVAMAKDPLAKNVPTVHARPSAYSGPPPGRNELARATGGEWTMASNRGPNAINPTYDNERDQTYYNARNSGGANAFQWAQQQQQQSRSGALGSSASSGGVGGSWGAVATASTSTALPSTGRPAVGGSGSIASQARVAAHVPRHGVGVASGGGLPASDGTYERNLVMELCPPGGMKAEPPPEKLASFLRSLPSLNPDLICPALLDALEDGQPWIIKAKALCVIEKVIGARCDADGDGGGGADDVSDPYSDFFHACCGEIEPLASHGRPAIRDPARRVLRALGIEIGFTSDGGAADGGGDAVAARKAAPAVPAPAPVSAPPQEPPNLLDFDDDVAVSFPTDGSVAVSGSGSPTAPPPASAPPLPTPPSSSKDDDFFGGLTVQAGPAAATAASFSSAPTPGTAQSSHSPATGTSGGGGSGAGGLFGGVTIKSTAGPKPTTSAQALPTAGNGAESRDIFGDMTVKASSDDAMSVGMSAAGTGSAFGFISGNTSTLSSAPVPSSTAAPPAPAPAPPAPARSPPPSHQASFDPLLSLGIEPTNAQKVQMTQAQIAQMQAMAYQQNMMRMQQQMQQMQLAMAMNQGKGGGGGAGAIGGGAGAGMTGAMGGQPGAPARTMIHMGGGPINPNVMRANSFTPMQNFGMGDATRSFSFLDNPSQGKKQETHAFDFVRDSMKFEGKK